MGFKDKAYGLNLLVLKKLQIELQLQKKFPHMFCLFFIM
jgi:hypothetical protein